MSAELENRMWEGGWTDLTGSIQKPDGWSLVYSDGDEMYDGQETAAPELIHFKRGEGSRLPPDEWDKYIRQGERVLKIFKPHAPMVVLLGQNVSGFEVGERYELSFAGYNDTYHEDGPPNLNAEPERRAARIELCAGSDSEWFDERSFPAYDGSNPTDWYDAYHELAFQFVATSETMTLGFRLYHAWGIEHNCWFVDAMDLREVGDPAEPPQPPGEELEGFGYPVLVRGSKLGVHAIRSNEVMSFAEELAGAGTDFSVVKVVDNWGLAIDVLTSCPNTFVIARRTWSGGEGCQGVSDWSREDMAAHAEEAVRRIEDVVRDNDGLGDAVLYWEPYNEPDPPGPEGYAALAELMIATMDVAEERGLKLALFSLNAGTPEWDEMEAMVETGVFARAREGGHVLALHEGTFDTHDPLEHWPGAIPGAPEVGGAGPLHFRYRYLYRLLEERGEVVPLVVSEWYCGDEREASVEELVDAMQWYDAEIRRDYYAWGFCPFTLGPSSQWSHTDYERTYPAMVGHMISEKDEPNATPGTHLGPGCVPPRESYERTYVLRPDDASVEMRQAIAIATGDTTGHSADDAGSGPLDGRHVVAVNPQRIGTGLTRAWFDEHYPGLASYREVVSGSPYEVAVELLPELEGDVALAQRDFPGEMGEQTGGGGIDAEGCLLTAFCVMIRKVYGRDVTPPTLDRLFVLARDVYTADNYLTGWEHAVGLFPAFDGAVKSDARYTAGALRQLLDEGWEVVLRRSDGGHFVYLEAVEGETLKIIDTWDGSRREKRAEAYRGIRAAHVGGSVSPGPSDPPEREVLLGLHDTPGGMWMEENGVQGVCLSHLQVQRDPVQLDLQHLRDAGITTVCRLNWGYADGTGTLPPPERASEFVDAVCETIAAARGVDWWHVGNEPNNPAEWPRGFALTPEYVVDLYNAIWRAERARMGPPPLDPYYGPGSDNSHWRHVIWDCVDGADAIFLHAKTQTNNPADVWSEEKFRDDPLRWQYLHLRTVETVLEQRPYRFRGLPVFVTECNPQHLEESGGELGWKPGNVEWVRQAVAYFDDLRTRGAPIAGVCFYRYLAAGDQAAFGLEDDPAILQEIAELA